jgi:chromosome segregation ATPase
MRDVLYEETGYQNYLDAIRDRDNLEQEQAEERERLEGDLRAARVIGEPEEINRIQGELDDLAENLEEANDAITDRQNEIQNFEQIDAYHNALQENETQDQRLRENADNTEQARIAGDDERVQEHREERREIAQDKRRALEEVVRMERELGLGIQTSSNEQNRSVGNFQDRKKKQQSRV